MKKILLALVLVLTSFASYNIKITGETQSTTAFQIEFTTLIKSNENGDIFLFPPEGFGIRKNENCPDVYGRMFRAATPKGSRTNLEITHIEWSRWYNIPLDETSQRETGKIEKFATIVEKSRIRDVEILGIDIVPYQFDPQKGFRYAKFARIKLIHSGGGERSCHNRYYHPVFERFFRATLLNPESAIPEGCEFHFEEWDSSSGAELLVVCYDSFIEEIQPWVDWRLRKGLTTRIALTSTTGSTKNSIKNYIQHAYETWDVPPVFVLLVGDSDDGQIPAWDWGDPCTGDNEYGCVDGTDYYPDVLPGRFAVDTENLVDLFVTKHLNYEKTPDTLFDWYARAVGMVREEDCPYDPHGPDDSSYVAAVTYAMEQCDSAGFSFTGYYTKCSGHSSADVAPEITAGVNFVDYRGQGTSDIWDPFGSLLELNTGTHCHITVSITCAMGGFHGSDYYPCEVSTRAGNSTNPRGSVAFMGQAVCSSNSQERSSLSMNIFKGFFEEELNELAAAHTYGKLEMLAEFGPTSGAEYEYTTATLVGGSAMRAWTGPIVYPRVNYPAALSTGFPSVAVEVSRDGDYLENARVTLHNRRSFSTSFTDSLGRANIEIEILPEDVIDGIDIVVTGQNIYPFEANIPVINEAVAIFSTPVDFNQIIGDDDSYINPGETFSFAPRILNLGSDTAIGLSAEFGSEENIIWTDSISSFPAVGQWDTVAGDSVTFMVNQEHPGTDSLNLEFSVTGHTSGPWELYLQPIISIIRFDSRLDSVKIDDIALYHGDDNHVLQAGEVANLCFNLTNFTHADLTDIYAYLHSDSLVFAHDSVGSLAVWEENSSVVFSPCCQISVSPFAEDESVELELIITGDGYTYEYCDTFPVSLDLSSFPTPTGPWLRSVSPAVFSDYAGEGDSLIEPGERVSIVLEIENAGEGPASDVVAEVIPTPFIWPVEEGEFGNIAVGEMGINDTRAVVCSTSAFTPTDTIIEVPVEFTACAGYYTTALRYQMVVGTGNIILQDKNLPRKSGIKAISPNPFNASFSIDIFLSEEYPEIGLEIYDITGHRVGEIYNGRLQCGVHRFEYNCHNMSSGIYVVKLETGESRSMKKAVLIK